MPESSAGSIGAFESVPSGSQGAGSHLRGQQGRLLPELHTCRAPGKTSLVAASTATGQVKQDGAELTLLV